jgi:subtilisin family serine protease
MTTFSSWGPTDDGRLRPDVSAPGCQSGGDGGVTSCTSSSDTSYGVACGTSMASPTVTGITALLLEDHRAQLGGPDPRNSTLKILLAHNAVDRGNAGPDYQFGYGSVRIQDTIDFLRQGNLLEETIPHPAASQVYDLIVGAGETELKLTLAWDDVPGTPNVLRALVYDLDLVVHDPLGVRHYPWTLDPANPSAAAVRTQADHRNNV